MFNAPEVYTQIPDIAQIYALNDEQNIELDDAIVKLIGNLFITEATLEAVRHWEKILDITPSGSDTLEDRRFRVQSKMNETASYSKALIDEKLRSLCGDGEYSMVIDENRQSCDVVITLASKNQLEYVKEMLDNILPLNMVCTVSLMYNTYNFVAPYTHNQLHSYTHQAIRETIF
jgi:chaperonin cofactor prefoldin